LPIEVRFEPTLAGAKSLMVLSLDGMPPTGAGLKHVITLPRLNYLVASIGNPLSR
jgi:hypothetical protein